MCLVSTLNVPPDDKNLSQIYIYPPTIFGIFIHFLFPGNNFFQRIVSLEESFTKNILKKIILKRIQLPNRPSHFFLLETCTRMALSTSFKYSLLCQKFLPPSVLVGQSSNLHRSSVPDPSFGFIKNNQVKMEKTIPRQFFDRIYGESSTPTVDQGFSSSSNSSIDLDNSRSNKLIQQVNPITSPYMNGLASFCKYIWPG